MRLADLARLDRPASIAAAAFALVVALSAAGPAPAQTTLKLSLDGRLEGPAALFIVPQDQGYFGHEGLDVTIDEGTTASTASTGRLTTSFNPLRKACRNALTASGLSAANLGLMMIVLP